MSQPLQGINDFVLRLANINGSGSASANSIIAKAIFRSGVPIGPKNIFPSNIQGLPTWYEIRVSEKGHSGRRGGVDFMVAMNPQTFNADTQAVVPGGYLLYDSTRILSSSSQRPDVTYLPVPLSDICRTHFAVPKTRGLLKNIVYVGCVAALLDIDLEIIRGLITDQYAKKPKILATNLQALQLGFSYCQERFTCPLGLKVAKRDLVGAQIMLDGNQAAALGCVYAGATVAAWYPITPSTSLVDHFTRFCERFRVEPETNERRYAIIQAEDELAAAGMVLGAGWNGARAFTATSGPGISLMSEFLGYGYYGEIPGVFFNVQRVGPATGMPTRTQQADLLSCAYASHGDTKHVLLFPGTPQECFEMAVQSFDLAERLQTPVMVLLDLELGMNEFMSPPLQWDDAFQPDRGKVLRAESLAQAKDYFRYTDVDGDGIPYRTLPGDHKSLGATLMRGSGHDRFGRYTEDPKLYMENLDRLARKFVTAASLVPAPLIRYHAERPKQAVLHIGASAEPLSEALEILAERGHPLSEARIRGFPFSSAVAAFIEEHESIIVIDQNRDGQLRHLLIAELDIPPQKLRSVRLYDGQPIAARALTDLLAAQLGV